MKNLSLTIRNKTILYVEDDSVVRKEMKLLLEEFFDVVTEAHDGQIALKLYNTYHQETNKHYDLVISDISMPNINGIELVEEIYKVNPKQNIIIISAYDDKKYLLPLIKLGVEDFLKKPIDTVELVQTLKNIKEKYWDKTIAISDKCYFDGEYLVNDQEKFTLTKSELDLLKLFLKHKNSPPFHSKSYIMNYISIILLNLTVKQHYAL